MNDPVIVEQGSGPPRCQHDCMASPKTAPYSTICLMCRHDVQSKGPQHTPATVDSFVTVEIEPGTTRWETAWWKLCKGFWHVEAIEGWIAAHWYGGPRPHVIPKQRRLRRDIWSDGNIFADFVEKPSLVTNFRPTGQIILVSPVPTHIPDGVVTVYRRLQPVTWPSLYVFNLIGNVTPGRALDKAGSFYRTLRQTKEEINLLDTVQATSATMNAFEPEVDANVAAAQYDAWMHGRTTPIKETLYPPEEHHETKDIVSLLIGKKKRDSLLMLLLLQEVQDANKFDDTMSDSKLAAYIRKRALRSDWRGPEETPDLLRQLTMKRLRRITVDQLRARREYFQINHVL